MPPKQIVTQKNPRSSVTAESPGPKKSVNASTVIQKDKMRASSGETESSVSTNDSKVIEPQTEIETASIRDEIKELFVKMDENMSIKFQELDTKFSNIFENFKKEFHHNESRCRRYKKGVSKGQ